MTTHVTMYVADPRRTAAVSEKVRQLRGNTSAPPLGVNDYVDKEGVNDAIRDNSTGADELIFSVGRADDPRAA